MSETTVLPHMSKTPHIHHHPRVHKSKRAHIWWSTCLCGHIHFYDTWKHAFVDAIIHSERLL